MVYNLGDKKVILKSGNHYIANNAYVIGDVEIGDHASVWFNTVIRGDGGKITIGYNSNIQDNCVLHAEPWNRIVVGNGVTVGHLAMLHGCIIGDNTLIGINSVILDDAVIGKNCIIGAKTLIAERKVIPDGSVVIGSPGRIVRQVSDADIRMIEDSARFYVENSIKFKFKLLGV
jgi:carbonic anhydrase/acetyltransferase-like protein (isoleucine patch superfamily)